MFEAAAMDALVASAGLDKCVLVEVVPMGEDRKRCTAHYALREPGTRMMSVELVQAAGYLSLSGDFTPAHRGIVSDLGYGLDWFAKANGRYLASKFLRQVFRPDFAAANLREWATDDLEHLSPGEISEHGERLLELADRLESGDRMGEGWLLYEELSSMGLDVSEFDGTGYDPDEFRRLLMIQHRWAQVWRSK